MKRADFDEVLREFDSRIRHHRAMEHGKKSRRKYLTREGVSFDFITDKWGWAPDSGWRFLIRVVDTSRLDLWGNAPFGAEFDVRPALVTEIVGKRAIGDLYGDRPELRAEIAGNWYIFDHQDRLRAVLDLILDPALDVIDGWIRDRITHRSD